MNNYGYSKKNKGDGERSFVQIRHLGSNRKWYTGYKQWNFYNLFSETSGGSSIQTSQVDLRITRTVTYLLYDGQNFKTLEINGGNRQKWKKRVTKRVTELYATRIKWCCMINKNMSWPKERIYSLNFLTTIMGKQSGASFITDTREILWLRFQLTFWRP